MPLKIIKYTFLLLVVAVTSCKPQFSVIRGDTGEVTGKQTGRPGSGTVNTTPPAITTDSEALRLLLEEAYSWLGTPYKWGGNDKEGVDCSGFVMMSYKNALGIKLPRTSYDQGDFCSKIRKEQLEPGDLIFFTGSTDKVGHVGIYIGDGRMIHSSSSRGVVIDPLDMKYYVEHFHHAGKVDAFRKIK